MMSSISFIDRLSMVWRQPERATFMKWMICGTIFESDASCTRSVSSRWPSLNRSSPILSSGPDLAEWIPIASTTISPISPSA